MEGGIAYDSTRFHPHHVWGIFLQEQESDSMVLPCNYTRVVFRGTAISAMTLKLGTIVQTSNDNIMQKMTSLTYLVRKMHAIANFIKKCLPSIFGRKILSDAI